eukprot:Hpha_TRINITY_DN30387_c0_g1::TRINITY_DN30387_c0_g1_i1::g.147151::m.147151
MVRVPALLNTAALGAGCPEVVLRDRWRWESLIEKRPYKWFRRELAPSIARVRWEVAGFLGVEAEEVVLYRNASDAIRSALDGVASKAPEGSVAFFETAYHSVRAYAAHKFPNAVTFPVEFPTSAAAVVAGVEDRLRSEPDVRVVVLDELSSKPALRLPLKEVAQ